MEKLKNCRRKIDEIDRKIVELLIEREKIVKEIARCKVSLNMDIKQREREKEIYNRSEEKYIKDIFKIIIKNSREIQKRVVEESA